MIQLLQKEFIRAGSPAIRVADTTKILWINGLPDSIIPSIFGPKNPQPDNMIFW